MTRNFYLSDWLTTGPDHSTSTTTLKGLFVNTIYFLKLTHDLYLLQGFVTYHMQEKHLAFLPQVHFYWLFIYIIQLSILDNNNFYEFRMLSIKFIATQQGNNFKANRNSRPNEKSQYYIIQPKHRVHSYIPRIESYFDRYAQFIVHEMKISRSMRLGVRKKRPASQLILSFPFSYRKEHSPGKPLTRAWKR